MKTAPFSQLSETEQHKVREESIKAIVSKEKKQAEVARELGVSRQAVSIWVKDFKSAGEKMPEKRSRGRPKQSVITPKQAKEIQEVLKTKLPADYDIEGHSESGRWNLTATRELILRLHQNKITTRTIANYLKRWKLGEPYVIYDPVNDPKPAYQPFYAQFNDEAFMKEVEAQLAKESEKEGDSKETKDEKAEEEPEWDDWSNFGKMDYEDALKMMKERGAEWQTFNDPMPSHGVKTGKHKKQKNRTTPSRKKNKNKKKKR